jgi:Fur family ferric uptake transcriptional regulator
MNNEAKILNEFLQNHGLKRTDQRSKILEVFLSTTGHISAYELHALIKKRYSNIGFSTVYRTLRIFVDSKLAHEVNFGDGQARYEKAFKRKSHGHIVCMKCGKAEEFISETVEAEQKRLIAKFSYKAQGYRFEIYGLCSDCQK